jgi:hypothetical protein
MLWMLPFAVTMFGFDTYRRSLSETSSWAGLGWIVESHSLPDFGAFVLAAMAWAAGRERRHGTGDQIISTALPRWVARLTCWLAGTCWAVVGYLGCVGFLYLVGTSGPAWVNSAWRTSVWDNPVWWPIAVNTVGIIAFSALGCIAGTLSPSRFTAPLAGCLGLLALVLGETEFPHGSTFFLVFPTNIWGLPGPGAGTFFPVLPDLYLVQIIFFAGLAVTPLGTLTWPDCSAATER